MASPEQSWEPPATRATTLPRWFSTGPPESPKHAAARCPQMRPDPSSVGYTASHTEAGSTASRVASSPWQSPPPPGPAPATSTATRVAPTSVPNLKRGVKGAGRARRTSARSWASASASYRGWTATVSATGEEAQARGAPPQVSWPTKCASYWAPSSAQCAAVSTKSSDTARPPHRCCPPTRSDTAPSSSRSQASRRGSAPVLPGSTPCGAGAELAAPVRACAPPLPPSPAAGAEEVKGAAAAAEHAPFPGCPGPTMLLLRHRPPTLARSWKWSPAHASALSTNTPSGTHSSTSPPEAASRTEAVGSACAATPGAGAGTHPYSATTRPSRASAEGAHTAHTGMEEPRLAPPWGKAAARATAEAPEPPAPQLAPAARPKTGAEKGWNPGAVAAGGRAPPPAT
mmetsp:Transcript_13221/g.37549  ORF Transcript_13221/g.37549 Transcript_13221/m.37549 type:complete len:401 (-) Transcript_13221:39-1241(-)